MYHPYNASRPLVEDIREEYIELHNRGFSAVDLEGWRISDGVDYTFGEVIIGPGEYLAVAADVETFAAKYPGVSNVVGGWVGRLSNSGETIELTTATGKAIDRVSYADQGEWARRKLGPVDCYHRGWIWADDHDGEGKSLELISMSIPNEYGQNWAASATLHGTPGRANTATGAPARTVTMVTTGSVWRYLDDGSDQGTAWREPGFDDSSWASGASQLGYGGDGETTVVSYGPDAQNKYITTYFRHCLDLPDVSAYVDFRLRILRDDGAVIYLNGYEFQRTNMPVTGEINYLTLASSNLTGADEDMFHEFLVDPSLLHDGTNVLAVEIHQVLPTSADISFDLIFEGTVRSHQEPVVDIAPMIIDTQHRPIVPTSTDTVTVTAMILDEEAAGITANVRYRVDGQAVFQAVAMIDTGDSVFSGHIPAYAHGSVIEFYVGASDAGGNVRTWPAPVDVDGVLEQRCNTLYQVDDSFDAEAARQPGAQPTYYIVMTEVERAELDQIGLGLNGNEEDSDAQMNATFISVDGIDTKVRYNVGLRNRGHGTRDDRPNNYRVNFSTDRPWKKVVAINLNTQYTWLQLAGSAIFQRSGLATGDARAVQVRVNGQNLARSGSPQYGSYVHVEAINSGYVDHQFPGNGAGNAYKAMRIGTEADLRYEGPDPAPYRIHYFKQTNESQDDWSDLIELTWVLSTNTPEDIYVQEVNRIVNVQQWLRFLALNVLLDNSETTLANGNGDDYYMYRGNVDTRFVMIQHDLDSIFGQGQTIGSATRGIFRFMSGEGGQSPVAALARLVSHSAFASRYYGQLKDLVETNLSAEQLDPFLDNLLGGFVPQPTIDAIKSWQATRNAHVLTLIPSHLTIESGLAKTGDYYQTAADAVALAGYGDAVRTRSVTVNGLPAVWSAIDARWSIGEGTAVVEEDTLISRGSTWRYLDDGSNQGTVWYSMDFDDSGWKGPQAARLGYGGDGETSPAVSYVDVEPGVTGTQKNVTTYFRREFHVSDPSQYPRLRLGILRDDGAVVYVNGSEVCRTNMPQGMIYYSTGAVATVSDADEQTFFQYLVDPSVLRAGRNVVAVEVHQIKNSSGYVTSSDMGFDLELTGSLPPGDVTGVPINPGITRVIVQAFDGPDGTGNEIAREYVDVLKDGSVPTELSGTLTQDMVLHAGSGPYIITGDVTVPAGITLTIQPGTTLFFNSGMGITINGRLTAEGTEYGHIRMAPNPPSGTRWRGLNFANTVEDNRLIYVDMEYGDSQGESIIVNRSSIFMNYMTFASTSGRTPFMELTRPQAVIRNCVFPSISGVEPLHGSGLSGGDYLIFDACTFGSSTGYNDIVDFTGGQRPGPIVQWYNSTFLGGGDDGPDLDGTDCHIEGCFFTGFHQESDSPSYAVATGDGSEVCLVRNLFVNNDHCFLHKEDVYTWAQNNTFVNSVIADVSFGEPFRSPPRAPGRGTYMDSNIHFNSAAIFEHYFDNPADYGPTGAVYVYRSVLPAQWHSMGMENLDADPLFVDPDNCDFNLQPGSPAIGTGVNGLDIGHLVPAGASISGEPAPVSYSTEAVLYVGGPGVISYRYRLVENRVPGAWSKELPLPISADDFPADPDNTLGVLSLTELQDGHTYRVDVLGKNSAGLWQGQTVGTNTGFAVPGNPEGNSSKTWTVNLGAGSQSASFLSSDSDATLSDLMDIYDSPSVVPNAPSDKSLVNVGGELAMDTVWTVQDGPYQVASTLVVPAGVTLTIMPGTTVFFAPGTQLTVNGRIVATGEPCNLIHFTITPSAAGTWNGIQLIDTVEENLISHAVIRYAQTSSGAIGLTNSQAVLKHLTWGQSRRNLVRANNSSAIIRNCVFPDRFGPTEVPAPGDDNTVEAINGTGIMPGGHFIIKGNIFGTTKGHNDIIDFSGPGLPGPILQVLNNVFMGASDECLDLGGDAWIEGNVFMHVHKDQYNTGTGDSNVISTGDDDFDAVIYVVRNVFYDVDHVVNLKRNTFMYFEHNTVVGIKDDEGGNTYSVINFLIPGRDPQGKGAYLNANIFYDIPKRIFEHVDESLGGAPSFVTDLVMHDCLIPPQRTGDTVGLRGTTMLDLGIGNFAGDPLFVNSRGDFRLRASSPAVGAAPGRIDLGAHVPSGAAVGGAPAPQTWRTEASLTVGGPGMTAYKYSLNAGLWSAERPVTEPIALSGLVAGQSCTVKVIGKNLAGIWQSELTPVISETWTVDCGWSRLVINEVLAHNLIIANVDGTLPDMVELYYDGPAPLSLAGMSLTDDPTDPARFTFGENTTITPGEYLVLYADKAYAADQIHLGFALDAGGEGLYLYDAQGALIDCVEFGLQIAGLSVARHEAGDWRLAVPTFGAANVFQPLGATNLVRINEWFAEGRVAFLNDFVEFYNVADLPVDLGGLYITDNPVSQPEKHQIAALNFVPARGYVVLEADRQDAPGHLPFRLSPDQGMIALFESDNREIDWVVYGPQVADASQGRTPDAGAKYAFFDIPSPGVANAVDSDSEILRVNLVSIENMWSYEQSNTALPAAWRESDYDDGLWQPGTALFYAETSALPAPKNTPLILGADTYYFRTNFSIDPDIALGDVMQLELSMVIDDAAVIWINGAEVLRPGFSADRVITHTTRADRTVGNAVYEYATIDGLNANLRPGDNVIAVEVHQVNSTSSDIVFGLAVDAFVRRTAQDENPLINAARLMANLRVTELMYNPIGGTSFEFVELQNIGDEYLDLAGVRLDEGITFTFPEITLEGGGYVVVVNDAVAFEERYGSGINVAGEFAGNLSNSGENIVLRLPYPLEAAILRMEYSDTWYPSTDGDGYALVIREVTGDRTDWNRASSWAAGANIYGSPGAAD